MFVILDDSHGESWYDFDSFESAYKELIHRSNIPWGKEPNVAPCSCWKECGRDYYIIEYDEKYTPWKIVSRVEILEISSTGVVWHRDFIEE